MLKRTVFFIFQLRIVLEAVVVRILVGLLQGGNIDGTRKKLIHFCFFLLVKTRVPRVLPDPPFRLEDVFLVSEKFRVPFGLEKF